jgi:hypothetical protein
MQELTEVPFNENRITLKDNRVKSPILPKLTSELDRDISIQGNCVLEGPVYARSISVQQGPLHVQGPVFAQVELHINSDCTGEIVFDKAVGSAQSVVSHAAGSRLHFLADINARQVRLRNAYVAASIFADEVVLENCVVIGGVFGTQSVELTDCVVGTFNSPNVRAAKHLYLLLPSAFSVEPISVLPGTRIDNLALTDLGALMRGVPEAEFTGAIEMDVAREGVRAVLSTSESQQVLRTYSVAGKVLATSMLDSDKLQNHFLLSAAALGPQLLRSYDLGTDSQGRELVLTPQRIAGFFFDLLDRKVVPRALNGSFSMEDLVRQFGGESLQQIPEAVQLPASSQPVEDLPTLAPESLAEVPVTEADVDDDFEVMGAVDEAYAPVAAESSVDAPAVESDTVAEGSAEETHAVDSDPPAQTADAEITSSSEAPEVARDHCESCGERFLEDGVFCPNCGTRL